MFKSAVFALTLLSTPLFAGALTSYDAITKHLNAGKEMIVVVHDDQCTINDPNEHKIPASTMVIKPAALLFTDTLLSFDATKYVHGAFPEAGKGLLQRGNFLLNNQGEVLINIAFFDIETNQMSEQLKEVKIQCHLGAGVKVFKAN